MEFLNNLIIDMQATILGSTILITAVVLPVVHLIYRIGVRSGEKALMGIRGGRFTTLKNGKKVNLILDNKNKNIFDCYMDLKKSKIELELDFKEVQSKLSKIPKEIREKYEI